MLPSCRKLWNGDIAHRAAANPYTAHRTCMPALSCPPDPSSPLLSLLSVLGSHFSFPQICHSVFSLRTLVQCLNISCPVFLCSPIILWVLSQTSLPQERISGILQTGFSPAIHQFVDCHYNGPRATLALPEEKCFESCVN